MKFKEDDGVSVVWMILATAAGFILMGFNGVGMAILTVGAAIRLAFDLPILGRNDEGAE